MNITSVNQLSNLKKGFLFLGLFLLVLSVLISLSILIGLFDLNKYIVKKTSISRLALHAASISFKDLNTQTVNYHATKNNEFDILLSQLSNLTVKI